MTTEPQISLQPIETVQIANIDVLSSDYLQIDNFLTLDEHQQLLNYVLEKEADFVSTSTSTNAINYRQSLVL
jgi:hypothetical protein